MSESRSIFAGELCLKILVASDFHGNLNSAKALGDSRLGLKAGGEVDATVICGDLSEFGSLDKGLTVLEEIKRGFENVFYVTGNHDPPSLIELGGQDDKGIDSGVTCLHGKAVRFQDVTLIGLSGFFPPFYGKWDIEGSPITRDNEAFQFLDRLFVKATGDSVSEKERIILVTHDPPYGVADLSVLTRVSAGSHGIRDIILKWGPPAAFCGHIHEGRGIARLGETLVINPGSMHFRLGALVEIENNKRISAELIKI